MTTVGSSARRACHGDGNCAAPKLRVQKGRGKGARKGGGDASSSSSADSSSTSSTESESSLEATAGRTRRLRQDNSDWSAFNDSGSSEFSSDLEDMSVCTSGRSATDDPKKVDYERSCPTHWPVGAYARTGARKPYSQNGLFLYAPLAQVLSVHAETRAHAAPCAAMKGQQKVAEERCGNYSDEMIWDRRRKHRLAGVEAVRRSRDFALVQSMVASGEILPEDVPMAPDADDRTFAKRQWERRMQQWRANLKDVVRQAQA